MPDLLVLNDDKEWIQRHGVRSAHGGEKIVIAFQKLMTSYPRLVIWTPHKPVLIMRNRERRTDRLEFNRGNDRVISPQTGNVWIKKRLNGWSDVPIIGRT